MRWFAFLLVLPAAVAQGPSFEAASIKPTVAEPGSSSGIVTRIGRIEARNVTLKRCIRGAYNIPESRVFGGPTWIEDERYDIDAKAAGPAGDDDLMIMLRALLADRFKLVLHRETRTLAGYALVTGKKGLLAKPSAPGAESKSSASRTSLDGTACSMDCLAMKLSEVLHLPVSNSTGIDGAFDFQLKFAPQDLKADPSTPASTPGVSVFGVVEEQLGLKLEARKVPTEVLVIDGAEKPSAN